MVYNKDMKLFSFSKKNKPNHKGAKSPMTFRELNKEQQEKVLKKGAAEFSKKFTKVIVKLANE
jgi:hypothetical protein